MLAWSEDWKVGLVHIQPGRPMQNVHVERFHGRLRDECLNVSRFRTLNDVRCTLAAWRPEYSCEPPHSSLDYRAPIGKTLVRAPGFIDGVTGSFQRAVRASRLSRDADLPTVKDHLVREVDPLCLRNHTHQILLNLLRRRVLR
jgi:transposase InsO family protein